MSELRPAVIQVDDSGTTFAVAFELPRGGFFPIYITGGLIFALLYEYSSSLWPAMIAHIINNTFWFASLVLASIFVF